MIAITSPTPASTTPIRPWNNPYAGAASPFKRAPVLPPRKSVAGESLFESLRGMDVFSQVQDRDLLRLAATARTRRARKGETLLRGEPVDGRHLYLLLEGEATLVRENGDGAETLLATIRQGEMAGEVALFDPSADEDAVVRAATPAKLLILHRDEVLRGLQECPGLAQGMLAEMARRLNQVHRRVAGICNQKAPHRVATALIALLEDRGIRLKDVEGRRCLLLRGRPTQRRIADLAGTRRETVSRLLARWEGLGWISDANGDLTVFDEVRLRSLAGEEI